MEGEGRTDTGSKEKTTGFNLQKWCEENRLSKAYKIFKERDVDIQELVDLDDDELKELVKQLGLDFIQRKRFIGK